MSAGDIVSFLVWETGKEFAQAKILDIKETTLGNLTEKDWEGYEKYSSNEEMYRHYEEYYNCPIDKNSPVKIIKFELI